jgi:O-antigen/teichoic acid export membrane protein
MEVPQRSMLGITTTLIAEAWKNNDRKKIEELYHKTSLNLLIIGLGLFGIIYPNMDNVVRFLGPGYALAKEIFLIAGIAKLVDLGMGMNAQILSLSRYWRFDFYTSAVFIVVNIILDFFLIKRYGLMGAAYGSAIALIFYNLMRCFYLWRLLKMQPFTSKTLLTILFAAIAIVAAFSLPSIKNLLVDGGLRGLIFILLFAPAIIYFDISEDITAYYRTLLSRLQRK